MPRAVYSLRMSFCVVPVILLRRDPLLLGDELVEQQQDGGRGVDRHRGRDLAQRDLVEQELHVRQRIDRNPDPSRLGSGPLVIGVVAHLGREVEGDRQPGLAGVEQVAEPLVRRLGAAETGVLAHGPEPLPVHARVDATREGPLSRGPEVALDVHGTRRPVRRPAVFRCRNRFVRSWSIPRC